ETRGPMLKCRFIDVSLCSRQVVCSALLKKRAKQPASALSADRQQQPASDDRPDAGPDRDVDGFLVLDRDIERADLGFVCLLRVAETAVGQAEGAGYDQYDCQHLQRVHLICSGWFALCILIRRAVAPRGKRSSQRLA